MKLFRLFLFIFIILQKKGLVHFNVKQRHRLAKPGVSVVKYVEVNVFGDQYRLVAKEGRVFKFTLNGFSRPVPFNDAYNGVRVYQSGSNLLLTAKFGLTVTWSGTNRAEVSLCNSYANQVCGLCGNGDGILYIYIFFLCLKYLVIQIIFFKGIPGNDWVDRSNIPVAIEDSGSTRYFQWGTEWKTQIEDEEAIDQDGTSCKSLKPFDPNVGLTPSVRIFDND